MSIDLSRALEDLLLPMGSIWLLLVIGVGRLAHLRRWRGVAYFGSIAGFLWLVGATPLPAWLLAGLEKPYLDTDHDRIDPAEVLVLLGGTGALSRREAIGFDLSQAADRAVTAIELVRSGKAGVLVIGGGGTDTGSESERLAAWIDRWDLASVPVLPLPPCKNTREEMVRTRALMEENGWSKLILVSSAYHLKRAEAVFVHGGLDVVAFGSDFQGTNEIENDLPFYLVPRWRGFELASYWLHERIGWVYYKSRGYL